MKDSNCIFCKIVSKEAPAHIIWEDPGHIAFLSIFPNTDGFTIVTTKEHFPSYFVDLQDNVVTALVLASKKVAGKIDAAFDDVGRTGLIFEGFGVDHIHAKLFPMHETKMKEWQKISSAQDKFFEKYEGYISSHDYKRENEAKLESIAVKIRNAK